MSVILPKMLHMSVEPVCRLILPSEGGSAGRSRKWVRAVLKEHPNEIKDNAAGIISELVANATIHAETGGILCRVCPDHGAPDERPSRPLIEVHDGDPRYPVPAKATAADIHEIDERAAEELESGRGLILVDQLSRSWGYHRTPFGKCVWSVPRTSGPLKSAG